MSDDLEAQAEALLLRMTRARRRAKPRTAEAFYDAEDKVVETSFGNVQAWRLGEGPAVLLVHGWEDDHALWGPLIDQYAQIGRAVVAFDLPGHGYSEAEEATFHSASEAVLAVAQALGPVDSLVAHSFGCPSSLKALTEGLGVGRAVLISSPLPSPQGRRRFAELGESQPEVFARAAELYEQRNGRPFSGGFDMEEAAKAQTIPLLLIHSMDDEQCPAENSNILADAWPGAELMMTDGLGHRLIAQDQDIMDRIIDFTES